MNSVANNWVWLGFTLFLVAALSLDTFLFDKKWARPSSSVRAALFWTGVWITAAFIFNAFLWFYLYFTDSVILANQAALAFLSGYLIEKSLSVDNLFAFYMIFKQFNLTLPSQQRILTYGIWGAVIFRLVFILFGVALITHFHWILYLMGAFLFFTGIKMMFPEDTNKKLTDTSTYKLATRFLRLTSEPDENRFFVRKLGLLTATPLFLALIFIEVSDIVFAFDSIPAIFAITTDPFIIWSSNIFALLGLRALYFLLAKSVDQFHLLKYGIALILIFIGAKMLIEPWLHLSVLFSLVMIIGILSLFTGLSIVKFREVNR